MLHIPPTKVLISSPLKQTKKWRFREKGQENGAKAEKDKTERVTGLGRTTRKKI